MTLPLIKTLIIEPDSDRADRIETLLGESTEWRVQCERTTCLSEGEAQLGAGSWDLAVVRLRLPGVSGLDALAKVRSQRSDLPLIAILESDEEEAVVDAARSLADDCFFGDQIDSASLSQAIGHALERREMLGELRRQLSTKATVVEESPFRSLIDRLDEAIFVVSADEGSLLFANKTAELWFEDGVSETVSDLLEYDLLSMDGVEMEISIPSSRIQSVALKSERLDWSGDAACMIALRDISKQKKAEAAYLECRRRLDAALANPEGSLNAQKSNGKKAPGQAFDWVTSVEKKVSVGKALIVDDEEALRLVLNSILRTFGFETIVASDGEEAIRLYEENRDAISLAIIDLNMPGLGGGEVFGKMRSDGRNIPILVMSGLDDFDTLPFDDFEKENSRFLMKPFGAGDVRIAIEQLLGSIANNPAKVGTLRNV